MKHKQLLVIVLGIIASACAAQVPTITSLSVPAGPSGTTETIYGTNFSTTPANNIVLFGSNKANVIAAQAGMLTVSVPQGTGTVDVSVSVNGVITPSEVKYRYTFSGGAVNSSSFRTYEELRSASKPYAYANAFADFQSGIDFDGDRINDDLVFFNNSLLVYQNTIDAANSITPAEIPLAGIPYGTEKSYTDLNGDGKTDIIFRSNSFSGFTMLLNQSSPGNIVLTPVTFSLGNYFSISSYRFADLDQDGKKDLVFLSGKLLYAAKNMTTGSTPVFGTRILLKSFTCTKLEVTDLNNDRKPEILVKLEGSTYVHPLNVLRNLNGAGVIDSAGFSVQQVYDNTSDYRFEAVADLDADQKPDLVLSWGQVLLRNTSVTSGSVSFNVTGSGSGSNNYIGMYIGDLDGDARPEFVYTWAMGSSVIVNRNNTQSIGFGPSAFTGSYTSFSVPSSTTVYEVRLGDINNDGRTDIYTYNNNKLCWFRNNTGTIFIDELTIKTIRPLADVQLRCHVNGTISLGNTYTAQLSDASGSFTSPVTIGTLTDTAKEVVINAIIPANTVPGDQYRVRVVSSNTAYTSSNVITNIVIRPYPRITSVVPARAKMGDIIRISGSGFETDAAGNSVYFGAVKGKVVQATATTLDVEVPGGASADHIYVNTGGLTATAPGTFSYKLQSDLTGVNSTYYSKYNFTASDPVNDLTFDDADADGFPDALVPNESGYYLIELSAAPLIDTMVREAHSSFYPYDRCSQSDVADMNLDGKPDRIFMSRQTNKVYLFSIKNSLWSQVNLLYSNPTDVLAADVTDDGRPDLLVLHRAQNVVSVYGNRSTLAADSALFGTRVNIAAGTGSCNRMLAEDLDGDGKPDLVLLDSLNSTIKVFYNNSHDTVVQFASPVNFVTLLHPSDIAIGDLDNDGKPDLVVCNKTKTLQVHINNTSTGSVSSSSFTGTFQKTVAASVMNNLTIADVNADGRNDLLSKQNYVINQYYSGQIDSNDLVLSPFTPLVGNDKVKVCDMNRDGVMDFVELNPGASSVYTVFSKVPHLDLVRPVQQACAGDTVSIVFSCGKIGATPYTLELSDASGNFTAPAYTFSGISSRAFDTLAWPVPAQLEGTGFSLKITSPAGSVQADHITIVQCAKVTGYSANTVFKDDTITLTGSRLGRIDQLTFGTMKARIVSSSASAVSAVVPGNLDYSEITLMQQGIAAVKTGKVLNSLYRRDTVFTQNLINPAYTNAADVGIGATFVQAADFDHDGQQDLLTRYTAYYSFSVYHGSRDGYEQVLTGVSTDVKLADMDNNGYLDLVYIYGAGLQVCLNRSTPGNIRFDAPLEYVVKVLLSGFDVGDLDHDGREDVVLYTTTSSNPYQAILLKNFSSKDHFDEHALSVMYSMDIPFIPPASMVKDIDNDGRQELLMLMPAFIPSVTVYRVADNRNLLSKAGFTLAGRFFCPTSTNTFTLEDLDNDQRPELITATNTGNTISVFRNRSVPGIVDDSTFGNRFDTTFNPGTYIGYNANYTAVKAVDLDADGRKDLCLEDGYGDNLVVLRNMHSGSGVPFTAASFGPHSLLYSDGEDFNVADMNGDGKPDLLTCYQGRVLIRYNQLPNLKITSTFVPGQFSYPGDTLAIAYSAPAKLYQPGNVFMLQVSDSNGNFSATSPVIGSLTSNASDTLKAIVPGNLLLNRSGYKLRILGTNPPLPSENTLDLLVRIAPSITSFDPLQAEAGSELTIYGRNFSAQTTGNTVMIGEVKCTVTESANDHIRVIVPPHAMLEKIAVSVDGLTAVSHELFTPTYNGKGGLDTSSFSGPKKLIKLPYSTYGAFQWMKDMDGDGRLDYVNTKAVHYFDYNPALDSMVMQQKIATDAFATISGGGDWYDMKDVNGDGLPDLLQAWGGCSTLVSMNTGLLYNRSEIVNAGNTSITNNIYPGACIFSYNFPQVNDFNKDGIMDFSVESSYGHEISMFSTGQKVGGEYLFTGGFSNYWKVSSFGMNGGASTRVFNNHTIDLDGDSMPDLVGGRAVFRNAGVRNRPEINLVRDFAYNTGVQKSLLTFMDDDRRPDVVYNAGDTVYFLRNTSVPGLITFTTVKKSYVPTGSSMMTADLDGDGKLDLVVYATPAAARKLYLFRNTSSGASVSYDNPVMITLPASFYGPAFRDFLHAIDLDGDKQPEIVLGNTDQDSSVYYFKNKGVIFSAASTRKSYCKGDSIYAKVSMVNKTFAGGNVFTLQLSDANGSFAAFTNLASITANQPVTIGAVLPAGLADSRRYRIRVIASNAADTSSVMRDSISVGTPPVTTLRVVRNSICEHDSVRISVTGTAGYAYSWSYNGQQLAANDSFIYAKGQGNYHVLVNNNGCSRISTDTFITVIPSPAATISVTPKAVACAGDSIRLFISPVSGYRYQWSKDAAVLPADTFPVLYAKISGRFSLKVTDAQQCSGKGDTVVSIVAKPVAVITVTGLLKICSGDSSLLRSAVLPVKGKYQWWYNNAVSAPDTLATLTAKKQGTYALQVTDSNGCTSRSGDTIIQVKPAPTVVVTASRALQLCSGDSVTLTANAAPLTRFRWRLNGNPLSSDTLANKKVKTSGYYSVTVTDTASCSSTSRDTLVMVIPTPDVTLSSSKKPVICSGDSVTLQVALQNGNRYQWFKNGTPSLNDTLNTLKVRSGGIYRVQATGTNSCAAISKDTTVTVFTTPAAQITAPSNIICAGDSVKLFASPAGLHYQWKVNGVATTSDTLSSKTVKLTATYSLLVKDNNNCVSPQKDTVITRVALPNSTLGAQRPVTFCDHDSTILFAPAASKYKYQWRRTGILLPDTTATLVVKGAGMYSVTVTDSNQCKSKSRDTLVTVRPLPDPVITASGPLSFCSGDSVKLTVSVSAPATHQWKLNHAAITSATQNTWMVKTGGTYSVVSTNTYGCTASSNDTVVNVFARPAVPTITQSGSNLVSSAASGNQWYRNGVLIAGAVSQNYTPTQNGLYQVIVTSTQGCRSDSSQAFSWTRTATGEVQQPARALLVYPNPNTGICYLHVPGVSSQVRVTVSDVAGKVVFDAAVTADGGAIDLGAAAPGVYVLKATVDGAVVVRKLVKE